MEECRHNQRQHLDLKRPACSGHRQTKRDKEEACRHAEAESDDARAAGGACDVRHGLIIHDPSG